MGRRDHNVGDGDMEGVFFFCVEEGKTVEPYHAVGDTARGETGRDGFGGADDDLGRGGCSC